MIISKIIQNLSNGSVSPEKFMNEANVFVEKNTPGMLEFVEKLSNAPENTIPTILETDELHELWSVHIIHQYIGKSLPTTMAAIKTKTHQFTIPIQENEKSELLSRMEELDRALLTTGAVADITRQKSRRGSLKWFAND
jgi:hypothetical protein